MRAAERAQGVVTSCARGAVTSRAWGAETGTRYHGGTSGRLRRRVRETFVAWVRNRDHEVIENTQSRVKIKSKLTNLKIKSRIEGYNGK